ncbi:MAG: FAD-dependent oxidoreductase [Chromatiales bacterium]|nr:FAD-dependent oxidoreductase [Chromatiales bacterium]
MKSHARVVVIGGGVVGASTLFHLAKAGWADVVLCERAELGDGATGHSAGLLPLFSMNYTVGRLHRDSLGLYRSLGALVDDGMGLHANGSVRLATTEDRMDEYLVYCGMARATGVSCEMLTAEQVEALWPFCDVTEVRGALHHPDDGFIEPHAVTGALAKGARDLGAEIYCQTEVTAIARRGDEWCVDTDNGSIVCEHVVSATGHHVRSTGRMVGVHLPAVPVQHQTIVTDVVPLVRRHREAGGAELPVLYDPDASYYLREADLGYILGAYEVGAPAVFADGVPASFGKNLFPGDLERLMPHVEAAIDRVPTFATSGIRDIVNGPVPYTPDGVPLIGPACGVRNFWLNEGHALGGATAGGAGAQLARWIMEGDPGMDMLACDPRRFGSYATRSYTMARNESAHANALAVRFPNQELDSSISAKTSPCHDGLDRLGAVWGEYHGWQCANWFAPVGVEANEIGSFRRTHSFGPIRDECLAVRDGVGLLDLSSMSKHLVTGPGAEQFLDRLLANRIPTDVGCTAHCHALGGRTATVVCEFHVTKLGANRYYLVSACAADRHATDYLTKMAPEDGTVQVQNMTAALGCLVLVGPRSREVLARLTNTALDSASFPWLSMRHIEVGTVPDVWAIRTNLIGELGWELHFSVAFARSLLDALLAAGKPAALKPVGVRAMDALRIEKSCCLWGTELTRDYAVDEAGIGRLVPIGKRDFVGREALMRQRAKGPRQQLVTLAIDGIDNCDARGDEPLFLENGTQLIGRTTAGAFGHRVQKSLALGYVSPANAAVGTKLVIEILGSLKPATIVEASPYDPANERLRATD